MQDKFNAMPIDKMDAELVDGIPCYAIPPTRPAKKQLKWFASGEKKTSEPSYVVLTADEYVSRLLQSGLTAERHNELMQMAHAQALEERRAEVRDFAEAVKAANPEMAALADEIAQMEADLATVRSGKVSPVQGCQELEEMYEVHQETIGE